VLRLLRLHSQQQVKYLRKQLLQGNEFSLALAAASRERTALLEDLIDASYLQAMAVDAAPPYSEADFLQLLERGRADVITRGNELESMLLGSLRVLADIRRLLAALQPAAWPDARRDIDAQLQRLLAPGFLRDTPAPWLAQLPRYLKAVRTRVERLPGQYAKDQGHTTQLQALAAPLWQAADRRPGLLLLSEEAAQYRWLLEEFRVSLFAQNLGTRQAVSAKRLQEQWQAVANWLGKNPR
jgi:ATP-dependent helicase HrpA